MLPNEQTLAKFGQSFLTHQKHFAEFVAHIRPLAERVPSLAFELSGDGVIAFSFLGDSLAIRHISKITHGKDTHCLGLFHKSDPYDDKYHKSPVIIGLDESGGLYFQSKVFGKTMDVKDCEQAFFHLIVGMMV